MIDRYARDEMKSLWLEEAKYESWGKVERAHLETLIARQEAPKEVLASFDSALRQKSSADFLKRELETGHDVIAYITEIASAMGDHGRFLHKGLTSSDVVDTSLALRVRDSLGLIIESLALVREAFAFQAFEHAETLCIGRTHGIHAEPLSFGQILANYFAEFQRCHVELLQVKSQVSYGKLSGAVGQYSQLPPEFEAKVMQKLGLKVEPVATQIIPRDRILRVGQALENIANAVDRFATNVRHWARTELGEVLEPFSEKQKGSSAMPHKKNPILSENLCGLSRTIRGYATALSQDVSLWHERDISHSSVERIVVPDIFVTTHFMIHRLLDLVKHMQVRPDVMLANLQRTGGLWASQSVLTCLIECGFHRSEAYELVQSIALPISQKVGLGQVKVDDFLNALLSHTKISNSVSLSRLKDVFDAKKFLRSSHVVFKRVFGCVPEEFLRLSKVKSIQEVVPSLQKIYKVSVFLLPEVLDVEGKAISQHMLKSDLSVYELRLQKAFVLRCPTRVSVTQLYNYAQETLHNAVMEDFTIEELQ